MEKSRPINVSLKVIADLSQGLYRSPGDALKELVSNAYDADSPKVEIDFVSDFTSLTVRDWGDGFTIDKFIETMETIGGSSKRASGAEEKTPTGRKIVGRIGIGLLSISQIANTLEVVSTVKNSAAGFRAKIEFDQFASEEARKIKITDLWEGKESIQIGKYFFTEIKNVERKQQGTTLTLSNFKKTIIDKLTKEAAEDEYPRKLGVHLKTTKELIEWMNKNAVTKTGLHEYDRIFFELCTLCPVPYLPDALKIFQRIDGSSNTKEFLDFAEKINQDTHFRLFIDGIECFKPILMPSEEVKKYSLFFNLLLMKGLNEEFITYQDFDKEGNLKERKLKVRGYIYFQRPKIWPPELQGLLIRVRNVAVGQYDSTFLTYKRHEGFKFSQISGEILVDDLDEALNIDRSSFRETEPSFVALREAIHKYLGKVVFPAIKLYAKTEYDYRYESQVQEQKSSLEKSFRSLDRKQRKISFASDSSKLVEREENKVILAKAINGKKIKLSMEFYQLIAYLEAALEKKLSEKERDDLYSGMLKWFNYTD